MIENFETLRNIAAFFATIMLAKYFLFLMIAPFYEVVEKLRQMKAKKINQFKKYEPLVSVIIPAWNEEVGIGKSIKSLLENTYKKIEIIVVSDGSTDNTEAAVKKFLPNKKIKYIYKKNGGKGSALNTGILKSNGDIIITMDADSAFEKHAIEKLVSYFADPHIEAVVGNVKIAGGKGIVGFVQKLEYTFGFYFKRAHAVMGAEYIFGGACAAFRKKDTFEKHGLFDTQNKIEDIEMSMRLRFNGIKCTYAEDVICYTEGASTIMGLIRQRLRWKKGRFDTFLKYRRMFASFEKNHNKFLTFVVLPFSMLAEIQLLFEPIAISLLIAYSFISGDYLSLALGALFIFVIYFVNALFSGEKLKLYLLPLFFVTWPLFYLLVWIEYIALVKSLGLLLRGEDVEWQKWDRVGLNI